MKEGEEKPHSLFAELKRRRVFRAATAYAAGGFVLLEAADLLLVPGWAYRILLIVVVAGFPLTLVLSWLFELTPEGLRRAVGTGETRLVLPLRRLLAYGGIGLLLLLLLGGSALWFRARASGEVARGADVIAVLPFITNGIGVEGMEEGIVDLLSRNLDQIGAIRTVDPRTVLRRWHERGGAALPREELREVGRELEAGSVLTGSVVSAGGRVRIQAELVGVDGARLAATTVEGEESRALELVDSLAVSLLREIWRSREPLPRLDVAAVTSTNPDALRAFLAGEQLVRISDWRGAADAFRRAVEADSGFALAHYRLYQVGGWTPAGMRDREQHLALAERWADRLPERTRSVLAAERALADGRAEAAIDSLERLARRYPDDAEIWLALADARFHRSGEGAVHADAGRPVDERLRAFDRALELDPGYLPALVHPLEVAFLEEDSARVARYLDLVRNISSVPPAAVDVLERGLASLRGDAPLVELISTLGLLLTTLDESQVDFRWQAAKAALPPLRRRVVTLPAEESAVILRWLEGRAREDAGEFGSWSAGLLVETLVATGRLTRASELLGAPDAAPGGAWDRRGWAALPALAGIDPHRLPEDADSVAAGVELAIAVDRRDPRALRTLAARLETGASATATSGQRPGARTLARLARGFARALEGNDRGLDEIQATLEEATDAGAASHSGWYEAAWLRWLELAAQRPELREVALVRLRRPWPGAAIFEPRRVLAMAEGALAAGRPDEAEAAYERLAAALADADPDLMIRDRLDELGSRLE